MKPLADCRLYAFVDTAYLCGRAPADVARQLCEGGADLIQLRAKTSTAGEIASMARAILPVTQEAGVRLVINDHVDIAKAVGAPACHLGQEDFFDSGLTHVSQVRGGASLEIGLSTHAPAQAQRAIEAGADYVAIGPIYPTGTKPTAKPVTLEYVRWAAANVKIPWFAIGGINARTIEAALGAGATRVCVVSAILEAPDIVGACRELRK
ncbi:MAG: thiamine phosphate synthase, partial [Verrucomicrobiota bacterium]